MILVRYALSREYMILSIDFEVGPTELIIRQGLTSNEPAVESIKQSLSYFTTAKEKEHVVPIKQGFYISLKGFFRRESRLAMVYAAFNYKG